MAINPDLTVVYYTCNREAEAFERRIQQTLLNTIGSTPLISVSQKPIDLGQNICVGEVGPSYQNAFRQLLIGAEAAMTRFVCPAEADFLHPAEYFEFIPPRDDTFYPAHPIYVLFAQRGKGRYFALKHRGSEAVMVVGRRFLIDRLHEMLDWAGTWSAPFQPGDGMTYLFHLGPRVPFQMSIPAVTFKTDQNMHRKTPHQFNGKIRSLPYWGYAADLINTYLGPEHAHADAHVPREPSARADEARADDDRPHS